MMNTALNLVEQIKKIAYEQTPLDRVTSVHVMRDYVEVEGTAGGDILRYRIRTLGDKFVITHR